MRTLLRALNYLRPYAWRQATALVCAVIVTFLGLAFPWILKILIDDVFVHRNAQALAFVCVAFLGITIVSALVGMLQQYLFVWVGERATIDLRRRLFAHIQDQALPYLAKQKVGRLMAHFTNDAGAMQQLYTSTLVEFVTNTLRVVITLGVLFHIDVKLALVSLPVLPLFGLCIWAFAKPLRQAGHRVQRELAEASDVLQESLSGVREVKAFTREQSQIARFVEALRGVLRERLRQTVWGSGSGGLAEFTSTAGLVLVLWVGGHAVIRGDLTAGTLVAFVEYLSQLFGPTAWFVNLNVNLQGALAGADRVFAVLDTPSAVADAPDAVELPGLAGRVEFEDVSFAYDSEEVLHGITFVAQPGEMVALVGPSGAGKTTLMNLIPRFADPHSGRITVDGYDLRAVTQRSLRAQIGQVFQDPFLFSVSVAENIRFSRADASQEEVKAAARAANADEFIRRLPQGYDTIVGERGSRLSGGEQQRLAIARALLRDPAILLLDEATSALDTTAERAVQQALTRLQQGRTSFVIAHRLSTILHADKIIVLEAGRIVGIGPHQELLESSPLYRQLYETQFRETGPTPVPK